MRDHLRRWGAVWILGALFLGSWIGQLVTQLAVEREEAIEHGQPFEWAGFWHQFFASTFENHQSEFLQLVVQAILLLALGRKLFQADNTASKDDVDEIRRDLARIRLHQLKQARQGTIGDDTGDGTDKESS